MRHDVTAVYGPRNAYGVPDWEVRHVGAEWVFTYRGGSIRQSWVKLDDALAFARAWAARPGGGR